MLQKSLSFTLKPKALLSAQLCLLSVRSPSPPQPLDGAPSSPVQLLDFCLVNFFPLSLFGGDEEGLGEQADASREFLKPSQRAGDTAQSGESCPPCSSVPGAENKNALSCCLMSQG